MSKPNKKRWQPKITSPEAKDSVSLHSSKQATALYRAFSSFNSSSQPKNAPQTIPQPSLEQEANAIENRLKSMPVQHSEALALREKLQNMYKQTILSDPNSAILLKLPSRLFSLYYRVIDSFLKQINTVKNASEEIKDAELPFLFSQLKDVLNSAIDAFESILSEIKSTSSVHSKEIKMNQAQITCFIGDFRRYQEQHCGKSRDFDSAIICYQDVIKLLPGYGKAWNQLGVVARLKGDIFDACYNFTRALHSTIPFSSEENLTLALGQVNSGIELEDQYLMLFRCIHTRIGLDRLADDLFRFQEALFCSSRDRLSIYSIQKMIVMMICTQDDPEEAQLMILMLLQFCMQNYRTEAICMLCGVKGYLETHRSLIEQPLHRVVRLFRVHLARMLNWILDEQSERVIEDLDFWKGISVLEVAEQSARVLVLDLGEALYKEEHAQRYHASPPEEDRNSGCKDEDYVLENVEKKKGLIVIDAANLAMSHGRGKVFSCKGIEIVIEYYERRGFKVVGFLPEYYFDYDFVGGLRRNLRAGLEVRAALIPDNITLLRSLREEGKLVCTPAKDYDDSYCLTYARRYPGSLVISRDRYRDAVDKCVDVPDKKSLQKWLRSHVVSYAFRGDEFLPNPDFRVEE